MHQLWLLSHSVVSNSLPPHGLQHTRLPCPSPSPRVYSNPCPLNMVMHSRNMETTFSSVHGLGFDLLESSCVCTLRILFTLITTSAHSTDSMDVSFKTCSSCSNKHSQMVSTWDACGGQRQHPLVRGTMLTVDHHNCLDSTQQAFLTKLHPLLSSQRDGQ